MHLSVLDVTPVVANAASTDSLRNSIDLARNAERLGFTRYWVAEHHNLPSAACTSPDLIIGQIAAATSRIRVGAGGVMLANHAPLIVAERFKTLEALFPSRIDLGIGRGRGADPRTARAIKRSYDMAGEGEFRDSFEELVKFGSGEFPEGHPYHHVRAMPFDVTLPPIWLLGSTDTSAEFAAKAGAPFAFAHHFGQRDASSVIGSYRSAFQGSGFRSAPYAVVACSVVCADTEAEAERLASSLALDYVRCRRGNFMPLATPDEAMGHQFSVSEQAMLADYRQRVFVGTPDTVRQPLEALVARSGADELMVTTTITDHRARVRSYELLARAIK